MLPVLGAIAAQGIKGIVDVVTIGLGLNRMAQRKRLLPVPPSVAQRWQELRQRLGLNKAAT